LVIGLVEAFVPADYSAYKDAFAFGILFIMLLVRPLLSARASPHTESLGRILGTRAISLLNNTCILTIISLKGL